MRDKEGGRWIDRRWDQTHSINLVANWHLGNWDVAIAGVWHTGWTTTRVPERVAADQPFAVSVERSNDRLKSFLSLDAKVRYTLDLADSSLVAFVEVSNLLNRGNKGGIDYEISQEDGYYVMDEIDIEPVFPLTPNVGVIWRF